MTTALHNFGGGSQQFAAPQPLDRLVRKEVALGQIREMVPPTEHIGLRLIAPFLEVATDDVVFDYVTLGSEGLAPARAEDSESELAQKDDLTIGQGRASILDWAIKDHYSPSDVSRYREFLRITELIQANNGAFPLTVQSMTEDFASKLARDDARRRTKLDNRLEWLIMTGLSAGVIAYNDGKIKFSVPFGRPAEQSGQAPQSGSYAGVDHDPINDILAVKEYMRDTHGVEIERAIVSKKFLARAVRAAKFGLRGGYVPDGSGGLTIVDPRYLIDGYGPDYAMNLLLQQTGITFIPYDSYYRTRAIGSKTPVMNRFIPENRVIFLPSEASIAQFDDTQIGFAKTLTAPHPEGNWSAGFYEWETPPQQDPWGIDRGTGIKAFPVFLHLDKTFTWDVTL